MEDVEKPEVIAHFRARLEAELAEVKALSEGTSADRKPVELDQQSVGRLSRMDAMQGQAMAAASDQRRRRRAYALESALRRMEEGQFGFCRDCGEPIPLKRLEIDPAAAQCVSCAGRT